MSAPDRPVFVGGVQRSGTHALGNLVGRSSRWFMIPREVVFHCVDRGLPGFLDGRISLSDFGTSLRRHWWDRTTKWDPSIRRGLAKTLVRADFDRAVRTFEAAAVHDPYRAARGLLKDLLDPLAARAGKADWVEMSPQNVSAVRYLGTMFPAARFVHVVRDGRDVACSLSVLPWGPATVEDGIEFWARRMKEIDRAVRQVGRERVVVVQLEDLVLYRREETYDALLDYLGMMDEPALRAFFAHELTPERAHVGRWRAEIPAEDRDRLEDRYATLLEELRELGVDGVPALRDPFVSLEPREDEPPNPVDPWSDGRAEDA